MSSTNDVATMIATNGARIASGLRAGRLASRRFARLGALLALAGSATLGCAAIDADGQSVDGDEGSEEITSTADALYGEGSSNYWSKSSDGITYIPVCWTFTGYDADKSYVRSAVEGNWGASSSIEFTGWGDCTSAQTTTSTSVTTNNVIRISQADLTPNSGVGTTGHGVDMRLNFTYSTWNSYTRVSCACPPYDVSCAFHSKYYYQYDCDYCSDNHAFGDGNIAIHEFGHALGFYHEQVRPENAGGSICNKWDTDETTVYTGDKLTASFDSDSVMSYCAEWNRQQAAISSGDVVGVNAAYGAKPNKLTHQALAYSDTYYQGTVQALYPGSYNVSDLKVGNDALSSLRVPTGWTVRLYEDSNYSGAYVDVTSDSGDLSSVSFSDHASSIVVTAPTSDSFPVVYQNSNYSGTSQTLRPGLYDVSALTVGNDAVSSISVPSGWTVTLYLNSGFSGSTFTTTSSISALSNNSWNDKASSIRVEGPANMSPVMVFKDSSYTGSAQALWPGRYDVSSLSVGNDAITSVIVPTGWTVTLHDNEGFWGSYDELTSSSSNLVGTFNDTTSSITVQGPTS